MRLLIAVMMLLMAALAIAHDLITAELAQGYLARASKGHEQCESDDDKSEQAKACLRIGVMLDEIRGYLNRDLAAHGEVQGLASNYLVAELERVGTPLAYSESRSYFTANSEYYRTALELGLNSYLAREARLRLLRGEFDDSFDVDPLETNQSPDQLRDSVKLVEQLIETVTREPDLEEVRFIAAIVYARAARATTDAAERADFRNKALANVDAFMGDYPDSLRSAAMPVVRAALYDLR